MPLPYPFLRQEIVRKKLAREKNIGMNPVIAADGVKETTIQKRDLAVKAAVKIIITLTGKGLIK